jgi:hypothetical protein
LGPQAAPAGAYSGFARSRQLGHMQTVLPIPTGG